MTLNFADNTSLTALQINASKRFYQNANRDSLEIVFDPNTVSFESLRTTFSDPAKLRAIVIDGKYLYEDYTVRIKLALEPTVISEETPDSAPVTEDRFIVIIAQSTYIEKALAALLSSNK